MNKQNLLVLLSLLIISACTREKTVTESSYPDGSPKKICVYRVNGDSKELIRETTYYPGRKIQMEGTYKNTLRDGRWIYYYQNGKLWSEGFYNEGKNDGKRVTYFENGKVRYEAWYKDDQRVGKWRFFDEKGKLLRVVNYDSQPDSVKK